MELEFDKEMDVILRGSREESFGDNGRSLSGHLDADEISAFAENVLPESSRINYISHFAECSRCRKILSNVAVLNDAAEPVADPAVPLTADAGVPWYRRFFVFPQIAYSMGALVLIFSAVLGYIALRNVGPDSVSEISRATEPSLPGFAPAANTAALPSNSATANTSSNTAAATNSNTSATAAPNAGDGTVTGGVSSNKAIILDGSLRKDANVAGSAEMNTDAKSKTDRQETDAVLAKPTPAVSQPTAGASRPEPVVRDAEKTEEKLKENTDEPVRTRSAPNVPSKKQTGDLRKAGGKSFRNIGGVWFDTDYNNLQTQISVKRGSDDYNKLDTGLRSIADQIGGTLVVAWKGKAYRIE